MKKSKMAEIRENYIHNRTVIIAPGRADRPHNFTPQVAPLVHKINCPFCPEKINKVKAVHTLGSGNRKIISIKNIFPVVSKQNDAVYGQQEVVIETPEHDIELAELSTEHIASVLKMYGQRVKELSQDKRINYILVFKNNGGKAGASIDHAHSQIFASEFIPPHVLEKLKRAEEYEIRRGECYYCRLIKKELRGPRWIGNDGNVAAFTPYASNYNYESWILTRRHIDNVSDLNVHERNSMAKYLKKIIAKLNAINLPYNLYLHQVVHYKDEHLYFRVCPRKATWAGLELGSRLVVNAVAPEEAAKFYREK